MERYDPEIAPNPSEWLELDEHERLTLVEYYHRNARIRIPSSARRLHAVLHVAVENQLAANDEPVVRALSRLRNEGLSRHDALHAIGSVIAVQVYGILQRPEGHKDTVRADYYAAIERLTVKTWHEDTEQ